MSTHAYRGQWGPRRVPGRGLTGEVCSDLLCCVLFPVSTTWRYLAVNSVYEPIFVKTRKKSTGCKYLSMFICIIEIVVDDYVLNW